MDGLAQHISIHALREEGDVDESWQNRSAEIYTPPPRAVGDTTCTPPPDSNFIFYPRPPRGGPRLGMEFLRILQDISIHALREEGDGFSSMYLSIASYCYPRPPRGGRPVSVPLR